MFFCMRCTKLGKIVVGCFYFGCWLLDVKHYFIKKRITNNKEQEQKSLLIRFKSSVGVKNDNFINRFF